MERPGAVLGPEYGLAERTAPDVFPRTPGQKVESGRRRGLRVVKQPPPDQRLDHYLAQWRQDTVVGRKSEGTTDRYDYHIRYIVWDRPLQTIQRSEVQGLYVQLAQDGLGNASINNVPVVLRPA